MRQLAGAERVEEPLPLLVGGRALDDRRVEVLAELVQLVEVRRRSPAPGRRVPLDQRADHRQLGAGGRRRPGSAPRARRPRTSIRSASVSVTRTSVHSAGAIQPCDSMSFHGASYRFGPIRREHVALPAVLADQRRGQAQPAAGLQVGGEPEDRRRQQVHLVVDDQAPVAGAEQVEVGERAAAPGGEHLVRGDGDRADLLALAASTRRSPPRSARCGRSARASTAGRRPCWSPGSAWSPAASAIAAAPTSVLPAPQGSTTTPEPPAQKCSHRLPLVRPQRASRPAAQLDRVRLAVDVPGQVLGRPAELEQRLLEPAALGRVHRDGVVVDAGAEHPGELLLLATSIQHRPVQARRTSPCAGSLTSWSRPYRSIVSATSTSSACGTG